MNIKDQVVLINRQATYIKDTTEDLKNDLKKLNKAKEIEVYEMSSYNDKYIILNTSEGKIRLNYASAMEIVLTALDAFGMLDNNIEKKLEKVNDIYNLNKF